MNELKYILVKNNQLGGSCFNNNLDMCKEMN